MRGHWESEGVQVGMVNGMGADNGMGMDNGMVLGGVLQPRFFYFSYQGEIWRNYRSEYRTLRDRGRHLSYVDNIENFRIFGAS